LRPVERIGETGSIINPGGERRERVSTMAIFVSQGDIEHSIFYVRGRRTSIDFDLATLYEVSTKALNLAVKRNESRFPNDFRFRLTLDEAANLRFQFETSRRWGGRRYLPWAFTQEGVTMLSGLLSSPRAVAVNIEIMRAFVRMRQALASNPEIAKRLEAAEEALVRHRAELGQAIAEAGDAIKEHEKHIRVIFEAIRRLMIEDEGGSPEGRVGFKLKEADA
jgi:phage regulator Rha-like protein